jgi:uncharacterized protein (TIGR03084 family)
VDDNIAALAAQQAELLGLLDGLEEAQWARPSRCEGWTVADDVLHVAQTNEMALASAEGRFADYLNEVARNVGPAQDVDDGAALMVERERGAPGDAVRDRYAAGAAALLECFRAADPHARVQWVAGELTIRTLITTRLAETWIHTGDVADGLGVELGPAERLQHIARLAWRTLPYAFGRAGRTLSGPVAFELLGPSGAPWTFTPDAEPVTTIRGDGYELCLVAARRVDPADTGLTGDGPDVDAVLELVRTYA